MEYKVSQDGSCSYVNRTDTICLGFPQTNEFDDEDIIECISDSIVHETIHMLLDRDFNETISCLFDLISDSFHEHFNLFDKMLSIVGGRSWKQSVKEDGMEYFLNRYSSFIDKNILKEYHIGGK
jgi:hypothetical protein